jgi:hypothetical protein
MRVEKLESIDEAAKKLLEAVNIDDHGDVLAWRLLETTQHRPQVRDDFYPVLTSFVAQAHVVAAEMRATRAKTLGTLRPDEVWGQFVNGIVELFKAHDWEITISKAQGGEKHSDPHPSAFVNFAWALREVMPKELRERFNSRWNMADALYRAVAKIKRARPRRAIAK